jgi:hypothetical protein
VDMIAKPAFLSKAPLVDEIKSPPAIESEDEPVAVSSGHLPQLLSSLSSASPVARHAIQPTPPVPIVRRTKSPASGSIPKPQRAASKQQASSKRADIKQRAPAPSRVSQDKSSAQPPKKTKRKRTAPAGLATPHEAPLKNSSFGRVRKRAKRHSS